jgi:hypothetical protein
MSGQFSLASRLWLATAKMAAVVASLVAMAAAWALLTATAAKTFNEGVESLTAAGEWGLVAFVAAIVSLSAWTLSLFTLDRSELRRDR